MFTQSVPAPAPAPSSAGLHVSSSSSSPASPTRSSRLRGLSYLRNYTQSHLLNREHSNSSSTNTTTDSSLVRPPLQSPASTNTNITNNTNNTNIPGTTSSDSSSNRSSSSNLVRSESCPSHPTTSRSVSVSAAAILQSFAPSLTAGLPPQDDLQLPPASATINTSTAAAAAAATAATTATAPTAPASLTSSALASSSSAMARSRSAAAESAVPCPVPVGSPSSSASALATPPASTTDSLPSIRFSTFYDPRSTRPSLKFATTSRTLPTGKEVIRVGRYSDRDSTPVTNPNAPSAAHVGFKSKVVSRRHCEFWFENNRWYIKDVKSSSGTFLNHIRLSQPGTESKPFPVNDGDIVQLGIDFKGGEEMIFRCVKIRIELNRGWQNKLNAFNLNTHKRLRNMTKGSEGGSAQSSQDCSICLNSIAPCQSLFVAPCSHTWHYKCVRSLLDSPQYPSFICPNCRAAVDLEADVEDPPEEWEHVETDDASNEPATEPAASSSSLHPENGNLASASDVAALARPLPPSLPFRDASDAEADMDAVAETGDVGGIGDTTIHAGSAPHQPDATPSPPLPRSERMPRERSPEHQPLHATSSPLPIPSSHNVATASTHGSSDAVAARQTRTPSPTTADAGVAQGREGPITPRNDIGPWVFDGSGIRVGGSRPSTDSRHGEMSSLDTAAVELVSQLDIRR